MLITTDHVMLQYGFIVTLLSPETWHCLCSYYGTSQCNRISMCRLYHDWTHSPAIHVLSAPYLL